MHKFDTSLLDGIDIREWLEGRGIKLAGKSGDEIAMYCPFHDDQRPSCHYNTRKHLFNCKSAGCGKSGDFIELVKGVLGFSDRDEAIKYVNNLLVGDNKPSAWLTLRKALSLLDRNTQPRDYNSVVMPTRCALTHSARNWIREQRITDEVSNRADLYCTNDDRLYGRIIIPIRYKKTYVGWAARDVIGTQKPKELFTPGFKAKMYLYDIDDLSGPTCLIVEGPKAVLRLKSWGFLNVVATFGATLSWEQAEKLAVHGIKRPVVLYDNDIKKQDNPGQRAAAEAVYRLSTIFSEVGWAVPPCGGPDDCDPKDLQEALKRTKWVQSPKEANKLCRLTLKILKRSNKQINFQHD